VKFRMCSVEGARTGTCLTIAAIALVLALCVVFAQSASAVQVSVVSPAEVRTGENFTVSIYVDPEGSEVYGAQYNLYFANTLLNATAQVKGPLLGDNTMEMVNEINNTFNSTHGQIIYGETRKLPDTTGVTEPGILANISFEAIAEENGISELWLDKVKLYDPEGNKIENVTVNHGNVSVKVGTCGDVTGDGNVRVGDGRRIIKWIDDPVNYPIDNLWAADVTGDGNVRVGDGRRIIKWIDDPDQYPLTCGG